MISSRVKTSSPLVILSSADGIKSRHRLAMFLPSWEGSDDACESHRRALPVTAQRPKTRTSRSWPGPGRFGPPAQLQHVAGARRLLFQSPDLAPKSNSSYQRLQSFIVSQPAPCYQQNLNSGPPPCGACGSDLRAKRVVHGLRRVALPEDYGRSLPKTFPSTTPRSRFYAWRIHPR